MRPYPAGVPAEVNFRANESSVDGASVSANNAPVPLWRTTYGIFECFRTIKLFRTTQARRSPVWQGYRGADDTGACPLNGALKSEKIDAHARSVDAGGADSGSYPGG